MTLERGKRCGSPTARWNASAWPVDTSGSRAWTTRRWWMSTATSPTIRRHGFHGLSYEYIVAALGAAARGRLIIAHLGNGASMAAVLNGQPLDTTMGFTPTGGLMMGTRSGDLDPGVLIHLMHAKGYDAG